MLNDENKEQIECAQKFPDKQKNQTKEMIFPKSESMPEQSVNLNCQTSIVVVGANGAGKSRLGTWLELKGPQREMYIE